jgi:signal peptidase I
MDGIEESMSRTKSKAAESPAPAAGRPGHHQDAFRETIESVVVALILAFLFRTFIAEAFVIPTGSMAPTLFGRHKDVKCPQCGLHYEVGASEELDREESVYLLQRVRTATCPNCRYTADIYSLPVFKGDRILVNKFPYEVGDPQRWDVCVFKFPEDPERSYIKRLIGLPGETVRLNRGDVHTRQHGESQFRIQRKADPDKQDALQILVYDDAHPPRKLLAQGWPERWAAMRQDGSPHAIDGWSEFPEDCRADPNQRTYALSAGNEFRWLRYRHLTPTRIDWDAVEQGAKPASNPRPQLVTDFYGYNAFSFNPHRDFDEADDGLFWVGDLTVSGAVQVQKVASDQAQLRLELIEGVRRYRCDISLSSGQATLSHTNELQPDGEPVTLGSAVTAVNGPGTYRFTFANVDDRLNLWVNGRLVTFEGRGEYQPSALPNPQEADLLPAGLAVRDADVLFRNLRLRRDIYYRAERLDDHGLAHSDSGESLDHGLRNRFRDLLSNPVEYAELYNQMCGPAEFNELRSGEYFMMGDNSPRSQDSRLWGNQRGAYNRHAVPRQAMVGKAFAIYWPHGIPFLNGGKGYPLWPHAVGKVHGPDGRRVPKSDDNDKPLDDGYPAYTIPFYPQAPVFLGGRWLARIR